MKCHKEISYSIFFDLSKPSLEVLSINFLSVSVSSSVTGTMLTAICFELYIFAVVMIPVVAVVDAIGKRSF